jgi:hypothetical protein
LMEKRDQRFPCTVCTEPKSHRANG